MFQQARHTALPLTLTLLSAAMLAACGGGYVSANDTQAVSSSSSDTTSNTTSPTDTATKSLTGRVVDGPIRGATVCLDLNKNGNCDTGEPTSTATDDQGHYTINGLTTAQINGAPLVAIVPANAVDMDAPDQPVGTPYVMKAPAGRPAQIDPVSTLVQAAIDTGMTLNDAEHAVEQQLGTTAGLFYIELTGIESRYKPALIAAKPLIVADLKNRVPLQVASADAGGPGYWVRMLSFSDANNYSLRYFYSDNAADAQGKLTYYDLRDLRMSGTPLPASSVYDTALYATPQGWKQVTDATANTAGKGNLYSQAYGYGYTYMTHRADIDVSGKTIAEVVAMAQDTTKNTESTVQDVAAASLSGTMPAGAKLRTLTTVGLDTPIGYRSSDGSVNGVASLAALVTAFPPVSSPTTANTVSMGSIHRGGCSKTVCEQDSLRITFGSANTVQFYLCDRNISTGEQTNCTAAGIGKYAIERAADDRTPVMRFSDLPAVASSRTFTRVFVERDSHVYYGWQEKPVTATTTQLNKTAFEALAAVLHITPPATQAAASPYAGTWNATYDGGDTGSCPSLTIDVGGHISGSCTSTGMGGYYTIAGTVDPNGTTSFTAYGSSSSGAVFSGTFTATSASGTWTLSSDGLTGAWRATKR